MNLKTTLCQTSSAALGLLALLGSLLPAPALAAPLTMSSVPLFITNSVRPNVVTIFDNSQSMDAYMEGTLVNADDPLTRSNIAKGVMRDVITTYRYAFVWSLMAYGTAAAANAPGRYSTYVFLMGSNTTMYMTDNCSVAPDGKIRVGGANAGLRCAPIPPAQQVVGGTYVTYERSSDDVSILDVLYVGSLACTGGTQVTQTFQGVTFTYCDVMWGISPGAGTSVNLYAVHNNAMGTAWTTPSFSVCPLGGCTVNFTKTDAGFLVTNPPYTRQYYLPRAYGFNSNPTGSGVLLRQATVETATSPVAAHYNALIKWMSPSRVDNTVGELKNGATYTTLTGTIGYAGLNTGTDPTVGTTDAIVPKSALGYFTGLYPGFDSPIRFPCQKSFVILVTDGMATGDSTGALYSDANRALPNGKSTQHAVTSIDQLKNGVTGTLPIVTTMQADGLQYRPAVIDAMPIGALTYVIGLGDTVQNVDAITALNKMAAAGGTGSAFLANDPVAFKNTLRSIINDIVSRTGSASAVSLNTTTLATNAAVYQARFFSGDWSGQVLSYPITTTGLSATPAWDAGQVINGQHWDTGRQILTFKRSTRVGVPFRYPADPVSPTSTEMDAWQATALNKNVGGVVDGNGAARLNYLRGDETHENAGLQFRARNTSKLGDIVNSSIYYVGVPPFNYPDGFEGANYKDFREANKTRTPTIYVGANDGMLHAFSANDGHEIFAYVPSTTYASLNTLTDQSYTHRYFVDGSPTVGDAFWGGSWKTVLVGGMRTGGKGFFALDVTNPTGVTEASAGAKVLWEYTNADDADLGLTFSQPSIVRLNNGVWAAVFSGGYNNTVDLGDGVVSTTGFSALYILNLQTGALIKKFTVTGGTAATPNGLATPAPADVNGDYIVDYIYAGDLNGKMWKFDVSSTSTSSWGIAFSGNALFTAKSATNVIQPITARPEVGLNPVSGQIVYFGTGQYLQTADLATTATQTFYGIWDNNSSAVTARSQLLAQSLVSNNVAGSDGRTYRTSTTLAGPAATTAGKTPEQYMYGGTPLYRGWYLDMASGERAVTDPILNGGRVIFTTTIPLNDPCAAGGYGFLMELDALSGDMLPTAPFFGGLNADGTTYGIGTTASVSGVKTTAIATNPAIGDVPNPPDQASGGSTGYGVQRKFMSQSDGSVLSVVETGSGNTQRRIMWRQTK